MEKPTERTTWKMIGGGEGGERRGMILYDERISHNKRNAR